MDHLLVFGGGVPIRPLRSSARLSARQTGLKSRSGEASAISDSSGGWRVALAQSSAEHARVVLLEQAAISAARLADSRGP